MHNFGLAKKSFQLAEKELAYQFDTRSQLLKRKALFMIAKSALDGSFPEGEKLILDFYENYRPDPLAYQAIKEIANIYYEKKQYLEAINFYNKIDEFNLSEEDRIEVLFKKGYCYFVKKDFENAERSLRPIVGIDSDYYHPAYYYMAMVNFYQGDYENAVNNFFKLEGFGVYKSRIPYYVGQIYFAQKKYDKIVDYLPQQLANSKLQNIKEIRHILGQTYFIQNKYEDALPHLEYYEGNSRKMRKEDFYQLAFTQYKLGHFDKASENFKELSKLESKLGQISNYYLADCYLKLNKKEEARVSFKNVINNDYDHSLSDEANFNYGKLSAELGYDRAAIKSLIEIPETSLNYNEAQNVLASLFESSRDYTMVISTIESMPNKAPRIKEAFQKVCLEQGLLLIKDKLKTQAKILLLKGAQTPINHYYSAMTYFYLGDLFHQEANYENSISLLNKYFTLHSLAGELPANANLTMANYLQGYNYLKLRKYALALDRFQQSKLTMDLEGYAESPELRNQRLYADVVSRIADCYLTKNDYINASKYYEIATAINFPGRDYAYFQRSMIKGLQNKPFEKIVLLEELIKVIPESSFLDDSYFQLGETQFSLQNTRAAELSYMEILALKGKTNLITRALLKLGLIAYNKGDVEKAIKYYTDIFQNNPNKNEAQEALVALEEIYIQDLGQADEFITMLEDYTGYKLSSLERDSISYMAAQSIFDNGEYMTAINSYTKYIDNFPSGYNRVKAIYNRAESHTAMKNYAEALPDYETIIKLGQSEYYESAIHKSALISYNDIEKFDQAYQHFSLLEEVTGDRLLQYEAQIGALRSGYRAGNLDAVLHMASKVINNSLVNKEDKALAHFYAGKMSYVIKSWSEAQEDLEQVIEIVDNVNAAESKYLLNDILFQSGEYDTAEEQTLETVSNSTAYPYWVAKNLILLSDIFMLKKDIFNAKAALEAVIENFPETDEISAEAAHKLGIVLEQEALLNRIKENDQTFELDTIGNNE